MSQYLTLKYYESAHTRAICLFVQDFHQHSEEAREILTL